MCSELPVKDSQVPGHELNASHPPIPWPQMLHRPQYIWEGALELTLFRSSPGDSNTQPSLGITVWENVIYVDEKWKEREYTTWYVNSFLSFILELAAQRFLNGQSM